MGISRSITIGYGVAVKDEDASKYLLAFDGEEGSINAILEASGWDLIGYDYGGCFMTGECVGLFYVKGTELLHFEHDDLDILNEFSDSVGVSHDALRQLNDVAEHFSLSGPTGWKLIANIS